MYVGLLKSGFPKLIKFLVENKVNPIGLGARDTLRLEAGLCLYGHDLNEIDSKTKELLNKNNNNPSMIICNTVKGKGLSIAENNVSWHYRPLDPNEYKIAKKAEAKMPLKNIPT